MAQMASSSPLLCFVLSWCHNNVTLGIGTVWRMTTSFVVQSPVAVKDRVLTLFFATIIPYCQLDYEEYISLYPPHNEVVGGVYWFHSVRPSVRLSVRPSVCPSVRPSVPHAVSALYHLQLWMDSFHIRHKWSLPWEGVSRTMTFDLDLYLQGHLALT